jgi:hypothetical protein
MFNPQIALKVSELKKHIEQANELLEELYENELSVVIELEATPDNKSSIIRLRSVVEHNVYL